MKMTKQVLKLHANFLNTFQYLMLHRRTDFLHRPISVLGTMYMEVPCLRYIIFMYSCRLASSACSLMGDEVRPFSQPGHSHQLQTIFSALELHPPSAPHTHIHALQSQTLISQPLILFRASWERRQCVGSILRGFYPVLIYVKTQLSQTGSIPRQ